MVSASFRSRRSSVTTGSSTSRSAATRSSPRSYLKLRRRGSFDFPVLGVAAAVRMDGDVVREARIVLGAVASLPREAARAAEALVGERLQADVIARAADLAASPSKPLDNTDFTHPYRKKMTRVYVARALRRLAGEPEIERSLEDIH